MESLLNWAEKKLKTDIKYLFKGGFWLAVGRASFMINGFILSIAFANLLPKSAFGTYQFVLTAATIIGAFTLSGMGVAIRRASARGEDGMLRYGFRIKRRWNITIVLIAGSGALYYFLQDNLILAGAFLIIACTVPLTESFRLYQQYLLGKGFFRESTTLGVTVRTLTPVAMLVTLFLTDSALLLVLVYFTTTLAGCAFCYHLTVKRYQLPIIPDTESVRYSKQLSVIDILRMLASHADKIILFQTLGATTLAAYLLAQLPLSHMQKVWGMVGHLVFPKFASHQFEVIKKGMAKKLMVFLAVTIPTVILFIILAPYIYKTIFPKYPESILMAQMMMLALIFKPMTLITQAFEAHKMITAQRFAIISTLIMQIILQIVLIKLFGVWGAVWSTVLTSAYWGIITTVLFYFSKTQK